LQFKLAYSLSLLNFEFCCKQHEKEAKWNFRCAHFPNVRNPKVKGANSTALAF
jgi:hypothetical protein